MTELELLKRIADSLDDIRERMPTWQQFYGRSLPHQPLMNAGKCIICGGSHGTPCPTLTGKSP